MDFVILNHSQVDDAVASLLGWARVGKQLEARYAFKTFPDAVSFTCRVAEVAEELGHHPEWRVAYRDVDLSSTTHDAGGLTRLDIELAERVDELARSSGAVARRERGADQ